MLFPAKRVAVLPRRFPAGMPMADGYAPAWWMDFVNRKHYYNRQHATAEQIIAALGGSFTRASTAYSYDPFNKLVSAASNALRRDYDPVTLAPKGILLEGARTNLATYSGDFTNSVWTTGGANITAASGFSAKDGTTNAVKYEATATASTTCARVFNSLTNQVYAFSVFVKKGSGATDINVFGAYGYTDGNLVFANVNYDTLAITYTTGSSGITATDVGGGWIRITVTFTPSTTQNIAVYYGAAGGSVTAGKYVYLWGAQLEARSFASSYIPTTSSSATRAADSLTFPTSPWFNDDVGTMFVEVADAKYKSTHYPKLFTVTDGASGFINASYYSYATPQRLGGVINNDAGVTQSDQSAVSNVPPNKVMRVYGTDDSVITIDGTHTSQDTSVELPTGISTAYVGDHVGSDVSLWIARVGYFPFRVSDAERQRLTS